MTRRAYFRILTALLWLGVLVMLVDVTGVILFRVYPSKSRQYDNDDVVFRSVREVFLPRLWKVQWKEYRPGVSVRMKRGSVVHRVSINSLGFRGPEIEDRGRPLIACLGGSTTVIGNLDETTYPYLMGVKLREEHQLDVEVLNCGIAGLLSADYMDLVERLLAYRTPRLVIEYNGVNDITRSIFAPARGKFPRWKRLLSHSLTAQLLIPETFISSDRVFWKEIGQKIAAHLFKVSRVLKMEGSTLAVASFLYPDPDRMTRAQRLFFEQNIRYNWHSRFISFRRYCHVVDMYNRRLRNMAQNGHVLYLPLAENSLIPIEDFLDICHLNEDGIARMADEMARLAAPVIRDLLQEHPDEESPAAGDSGSS